MSAFNLFSTSPPLVDHWVKRFIAAIVDAVITWVVYWVLAAFLFLAFLGNPIGGFAFLGAFLWGLIFLLYAIVMDLMGGTIGKRVVGLRPTTLGGQPINPMQAVLRNLSKIHPLLFLLDLLVGLFTEGDPRQKMFERFGGSTVTRTDAAAYQEEQFRQMGHAAAYTPPGGTPATPQPGWQAPVAASPAPVQLTSPGSPVAATAQVQQQPQTAQAWPPQQPPTGAWPQHQWDEQGRIQPTSKFCTQCGGNLVPRGDGKMTCVRCGSVF